MANVHGLGDLNNQNNRNNRNNNAGENYQNLNPVSDDIPFINSMKSNREPIQQTIPYTLKLICCPDLRICSSTIIFLMICWILYIICLTQGIEQKNFQVLQVQQDVLIDFGGALGTLIQQGQVFRLLTASFLHANLMHIFMNSISLLFIASRFEKIYPKQTPIVLLVSSITGFMLSVLCSRTTLTVGASTAIFGVLGGFIAYLIINWTALQRFGQVRSTLACIIGVIVFISFIFSIGSSIDAIAHLGGLIGGIFTSLAILPGMQLKNHILTKVGILAIIVINLTTFIIFFAGN